MNFSQPDGTLHRPSSGAEGCLFMAEWCDKCERRGEDDETGCAILSASFLGEVPQWTWQGGFPTCSAFKPLPPGPDDPPPFDPRQMALELEPATGGDVLCN